MRLLPTQDVSSGDAGVVGLSSKGSQPAFGTGALLSFSVVQDAIAPSVKDIIDPGMIACIHCNAVRNGDACQLSKGYKIKGRGALQNSVTTEDDLTKTSIAVACL